MDYQICTSGPQSPPFDDRCQPTGPATFGPVWGHLIVLCIPSTAVQGKLAVNQDLITSWRRHIVFREISSIASRVCTYQKLSCKQNIRVLNAFNMSKSQLPHEMWYPTSASHFSPRDSDSWALQSKLLGRKHLSAAGNLDFNFVIDMDLNLDPELQVLAHLLVRELSHLCLWNLGQVAS